MSKVTILIVDDEPDIRELLAITLQRMGFATLPAADLQQAYVLLQQQHFQLCLTDLRLPDGSGLELVQRIQAQHPQLPVAVISAHGTMEVAIDAMKYGAFDFISKPLDLTQLRSLVLQALAQDQTPLPDPASLEGYIVGRTPAMVALREQINKVARSQAPVFISGPSGSGKERVARALHQQSTRANQPFVAVNCGAIPRELMESEFFGHKKGSFTGAQFDKPGLFAEAHGGVLFLDEVADLDLSMQVKLLRVLQEKTIRPVGSTKEQPIDVRIISATHKPLAQCVAENSFRQDLYYRLHVIELKVPALKDRAADIPLLTAALLQHLAQNHGCSLPRLSQSAQDALQRYDYPGNVRELDNILERALVLSNGALIQPDDLQLPDNGGFADDATLAPGALPTGTNLEHYLDDIEKAAIVAALEDNQWNKTAAAKQLGISFRALRYRLKKLDLE